jgi:hypothetical protein
VWLQANMVTVQCVRAVVNVMDVEPRCCSHLVSEGLLHALVVRMQQVSDMDVVEQCVKW